MRLAPHRRACPGQRCALPTAPAFAHKLHSLRPVSVSEPERYKAAEALRSPAPPKATMRPFWAASRCSGELPRNRSTAPMATEKRVVFRSTWLPWLLMGPQLAVIGIFFFWPATQAVLQSLQQQDAFGISTEWVGLAN